MQLFNICLPFDVEVQSQGDDCRLQWAAQSIVLTDGTRRWISAYRRFGIRIATHGRARTKSAVRLLPPFAAPAAAGRPARAAASESSVRSLTLGVARAVFSAPDAAWTRAHAAAMFGVSKEILSARMLAEGSALTQIICEQRLMRTLFDVAQGMPHRSRYGFPSIERRDSAFYDQFGMSIEEFSWIARAGHFGLSAGPWPNYAET